MAHPSIVPSHDPDTIERVAETLYRQHRARHGHAYAWGEWDRAGSLQDQFREDARKVIAATQRAEYRAHAICYWSEAARTLVLDATPKAATR